MIALVAERLAGPHPWNVFNKKKVLLLQHGLCHLPEEEVETQNGDSTCEGIDSLDWARGMQRQSEGFASVKSVAGHFAISLF